MAIMSSKQVDSVFAASPTVLDLAGTGVSTRAASHGAMFDLNGTGQASKVGRVAPTDGLLVMDRNHDGKINDGSEFFRWPPSWPTAAALATAATPFIGGA